MQQSTNRIFMVRPAHFGYNEQTAVSNTFQQQPQQKDDLASKALSEFDRMVAELREKKIEVWVIADREDLVNPDAVFPNNWISTHEEGTIVLYPMLTPNRRTERRADVVQSLKDHYPVHKVVDLSRYESEGIFLEGTGSIVFDHTARVAYACISPRTDKTLLDRLCAEMGYNPISFRAVNEQGVEIYHTNVVMGIGSGYAVICLDSIAGVEEREKVTDALRASGKKIVDISFEQMNRFGGNVLELKSPGGTLYLALSSSAYDSFTPQQRDTLQEYCSLLPFSIPTIETIGGGSVRCMIAQNFLPLQ